MKLGQCKVTNFGSYRSLEFDFSATGLSLIHGPTGSGKSTIFDIPCWILFGKTAKGGNADEIKTWQVSEPTGGHIELDLGTSRLAVFRTRGSSKDNDLFWYESSKSGDQASRQIRGKDLPETQRLLEERLGISYSLYCTGSYFTEFGPTSHFFTAKAKDRREILESIAPLDLPILIAERASEARKETKKALEQAKIDQASRSGRLDTLKASLSSSHHSLDEWSTSQQEAIKTLKTKFKGFEVEKDTKIQALQTASEGWDKESSKKIDSITEKINNLKLKSGSIDLRYARRLYGEMEDQLKILQAEKCPTCGGPALSDTVEKHREQMENARAGMEKYSKALAKLDALNDQLTNALSLVNPHTTQLEAARAMINRYGDQLEAEQKKVNPFKAQINKAIDEIAKTENGVMEATNEVNRLSHYLVSLNTLYDLSFKLRAELLQRSIREAQAETNRVLEAHFNAEIKVVFSANSGDDLDASIYKSGYQAVFTQLSKGQRCMLKLAFGLAIMKQSANNAGVHFSNLFMDEPLAGLDPELKAKTYSLFQELSLEHENVMVIEHSRELEQMFDKKYEVNLEGDESQICPSQ